MGKHESARTGRRMTAPRIVASALACTAAMLVALFGTAFAETIISTNVSASTTWTVGGSPYIIVGDAAKQVLVKNGSTLTIDPGVEVRFASGAKLGTDANGSIRAVGTPSDSIRFTSNSPTPAVSDWKNIQVFASPNSEFRHCVFEYGENGLYISVSQLDVTRCRFSNCYTSIFVSGASPNITECWLTHSAYYGVWCQHYESQPVIYHCNFIGNGMNLRLDYYTQPTSVTAVWNWWGSNTESSIRGGIVDSSDGIGSGTVLYSPWLSEVPVEEASWGRIKALFR